MTRPAMLDLRGEPLSPATVSPAVDHLAAGGILAYPTETVYGFGGLCRGEVVEKVRRMKRREADRPLLVLIPDRSAASALRWTPEARELAAVFWPGALTLVLADPSGAFPPGVRSPEGTVAVRVSPHPFVAALLAVVGEPLTSTSANAPGEAPALNAADALEAAVRVGGGGDVMVVDTGPLPPSSPSTLVDCTGAAPTVLREGSIPLSRLRCALPHVHGP